MPLSHIQLPPHAGRRRLKLDEALWCLHCYLQTHALLYLPRAQRHLHVLCSPIGFYRAYTNCEEIHPPAHVSWPMAGLLCQHREALEANPGPEAKIPFAFVTMFSCERAAHLLHLYSLCENGGGLVLMTQEGSFPCKVSGEMHLVLKSTAWHFLLVSLSRFPHQMEIWVRFIFYCFILPLASLWAEPRTGLAMAKVLECCCEGQQQQLAIILSCSRLSPKNYSSPSSPRRYYNTISYRKLEKLQDFFALSHPGWILYLGSDATPNNKGQKCSYGCNECISSLLTWRRVHHPPHFHSSLCVTEWLAERCRLSCLKA